MVAKSLFESGSEGSESKLNPDAFVADQTRVALLRTYSPPKSVCVFRIFTRSATPLQSTSKLTAASCDGPSWSALTTLP
jgi:hypothetical protein